MEGVKNGVSQPGGVVVFTAGEMTQHFGYAAPKGRQSSLIPMTALQRIPDGHSL